MDSFKSLVKIALLFTLFIFGFISINTVPYDFRSTVVKIYNPIGGHGSGSIISSTDKKTLFLTNRHVCEGATYTNEEIKIMTKILNKGFICNFEPNNKDCINVKNEYTNFITSINHLNRKVMIKFNNYNNPDIEGRVVKMSDKADLCLIETNGGKFPIMQISRVDAIPGDKIKSIGNPKYMVNHQTDGYVGDDMYQNNRRYQLHSGIIYTGNSGGPVVSSRGELVGINTLGTTEPSASYMIPVSIIKDFLRE